MNNNICDHKNIHYICDAEVTYKISLNKKGNLNFDLINVQKEENDSIFQCIDCDITFEDKEEVKKILKKVKK